MWLSFLEDLQWIPQLAIYLCVSFTIHFSVWFLSAYHRLSFPFLPLRLLHRYIQDEWGKGQLIPWEEALARFTTETIAHWKARVPQRVTSNATLEETTMDASACSLENWRAHTQRVGLGALLTQLKNPASTPLFRPTLLWYLQSIPKPYSILKTLNETDPPPFKMALDLGCNTGTNILGLLALAQVLVGIDVCALAIETTKDIFQGLVKKKKCIFLKASLEAFPDIPRLPEKVDFIYAENILGYVNPTKLTTLMDALYDRMEDGAFFMGDFFHWQKNDAIRFHQLLRNAYGGWCTDVPTVRALFEKREKKFMIHTLKVFNDGNGVHEIRFVVTKGLPKQ